jgi:hypothetical protein
MAATIEPTMQRTISTGKTLRDRTLSHSTALSGICNSPLLGKVTLHELYGQKWKAIPADGWAVCVQLSVFKARSPKSGFL